MKTQGIIAAIPVLLLACTEQADTQTRYPSSSPQSILHTAGNTVSARIQPPAGYNRVPALDGSYADFLRKLALQPHGSQVHYYDGSIKANTAAYMAVVRMDVGTKDLQQCADAIMRLRAEYLFQGGQQDKIGFHFTNGFYADYDKWQQGYRISVKGNKVQWVKTAQPSDAYSSFRQYLDVVYSYAGTLSLSRELQSVPYSDMRIGDVLIQGGSPGHAVTVVDMAVNAQGKKLYLLAQSYMPAQEIQILTNPNNAAISPWYELDAQADIIHTPEWDFTTANLKRFKE